MQQIRTINIIGCEIGKTVFYLWLEKLFEIKNLNSMKTKMLLAGLALFAFTTVGFAEGAPKKAATPAKAACATPCTKAEAKSCCKAEAKPCCSAAKAEKAPAANSATTPKKAVVKPAAKK